MDFARKVLDILTTILEDVALIPYRLVFRRNTRDPILAILSTTNSADCKEKVELWFILKLREAQYVQIAVSAPTSFEILPPRSCPDRNILTTKGNDPLRLNSSFAVLACCTDQPLVWPSLVVLGSPTIADKCNFGRTASLAITAYYQSSRSRCIQAKDAICTSAHAVSLAGAYDVLMLLYHNVSLGVDCRCHQSVHQQEDLGR